MSSNRETDVGVGEVSALKGLKSKVREFSVMYTQYVSVSEPCLYIVYIYRLPIVMLLSRSTHSARSASLRCLNFL